MKEYLVNQEYQNYVNRDHEIWKKLYNRQCKLSYDRVSKKYLEGFNRLEIDQERIVKIEEVSNLLVSISGWSLVAVNGLLPAKDFFEMIINRKYPVTVSLRKPDELDFSEQPDIFHDICGHLPLLTNEKFAGFLTEYSKIAYKYVSNPNAVDYLARLYWFTYETGLINEDNEVKPYGAAIVTSAKEINNVENAVVKKHAFDIDKIFQTAFTPYSIQKEYFVIDSFDDLFCCIDNLESKLLKHLVLQEI